MCIRDRDYIYKSNFFLLQMDWNQKVLELSRDLCEVGDLSKHFRCPIHKGLLIDPVVDKCGHTFCSICITKHLSEKRQCPIDKNTDIKGCQLRKNLQVQTLIDELMTYCPRLPICNWRGKFEKLKHHFDKECMYRFYPCPLNSCDAKLYKWELKDHLNNECEITESTCKFCNEKLQNNDKHNHLMNTCEAIPIVCTNKCGETPARKNLEEHLRLECKQTVVVCPCAEEGCTFVGTRGALQAHLQAFGEKHSENGYDKCDRLALKLRKLKKELELQRKSKEEFLSNCKKRLKQKVNEICSMKISSVRKSGEYSPGNEARQRSRSRSRERRSRGGSGSRISGHTESDGDSDPEVMEGPSDEEEEEEEDEEQERSRGLSDA
eukprot:TRINITY_DN9770_c0_g1_i1.p1 TRINITY_DN9770_c0_g1~~TRINITY_DN9770_c0_g1_i1.p1  ORF type:complete len:401 (+),score=48.60 TRINITY_DN9770_c0_g1_i1:71-1204(+)